MKPKLRISDAEFNQWLTDTIRITRAAAEEGKRRDFDSMLVTYEYVLEKGNQMRARRSETTLRGLQTEARSHVLEALGHDAARAGVMIRAIYFVGSAWFAELQDTPDSDARFARASQHPERKEVIVVGGLSIDGRANMGWLFVERDPEDFLRVGEVRIHYYDEGQEAVLESNLCQSFYAGYRRGTAQFLDKAASRSGGKFNGHS